MAKKKTTWESAKKKLDALLAAQKTKAARDKAITMLARAARIGREGESAVALDERLKKLALYIEQQELLDLVVKLAEDTTDPISIGGRWLLSIAVAHTKAERGAAVAAMREFDAAPVTGANGPYSWRSDLASLPEVMGVVSPHDQGDRELIADQDDQLATPIADLVALLELKGKQRRVVELLIERGGTIPLIDLAVDAKIGWGANWENSYRKLCQAVNPKLRKVDPPYRLYRHDNKAVLKELGPKIGQ